MKCSERVICVLCVITATYLTTCNPYRSEYLSTHPNLDKQTREAIENGHFFVGMDKEQVRASLGKPDRINKTAIGNEVTEQWCYGTWTYLYFKQGVLVAWQN